MSNLEYRPEEDTSLGMPEKHLMLAVLEEALTVFQIGLDSDDPRARRYAVEVEEWVDSEDMDPVFSFESICAALDIDAESIRAWVRGRRRAVRKGEQLRVARVRRATVKSRAVWRTRMG